MGKLTPKSGLTRMFQKFYLDSEVPGSESLSELGHGEDATEGSREGNSASLQSHKEARSSLDNSGIERHAFGDE